MLTRKRTTGFRGLQSLGVLLMALSPLTGLAGQKLSDLGVEREIGRCHPH